MMTKQGIDWLKQKEALRLISYQDSEKVWTIGWGHTGGVSEDMNINETEAEEFLKDDLKIAELDASSLIFNFYKFSSVRQDALIALSFQLGKPVLMQFHDFLNDIRLEKWEQAAVDLEHSLWYRQMLGQNGHGMRGKETCYMIRTGLYMNEIPGKENVL
jgi:lysozyme